MKRTLLGVAGSLIAVAAVGLHLPGGAPVEAQAPASAVPGTTARQAIEAAAAAMGGADRLRALRNITLVGYGQYAYQQGGGNITSLPTAPQKFIAANDLRRIHRGNAELLFPRFRA